MAFDLSNYNMDAGSVEAAVASQLNAVFEALEDGVSLSDDAGPVALGIAAVFSALKGRPKGEIAMIVAKAAIANVFDELAERPAPA